jgi:hypothetical protein
MKLLIPTFLLLSGILLLAFGCHHATEPPAPSVDTTSHNFTWQLELLGNGAGSGYFYDVTIINDTLAYAVGRFFMKDSLGKDDPMDYNLARWNGRAWSVGRVYYGSSPLYGEVNAVFGFAPDDGGCCKVS